LIEVELPNVLFPEVLVAITAISRISLLVRSEGAILTVVSVPEYIQNDQTKVCCSHQVLCNTGYNKEPDENK
jgi:hypothetical protein